jgi:hypothetical protein
MGWESGAFRRNDGMIRRMSGYRKLLSARRIVVLLKQLLRQKVKRRSSTSVQEPLSP